MVIAIVSAKGGTGKSTITLNLAGAFLKIKRKVLIVDTDPQGSITQWAAIRKQEEPDILSVSARGFDKKSKKLAKRYEIILIDTPPTFKKSMRSVIHAADRLIIPVSPGLADYWSTEQLLDFYRAEKEKRLNLDARLLISRIDRRTRLGRDFRFFLERLSIPIFMTEIPQRVIYSESWHEGLTVDRLQPNGSGTKDFRLLVKEILVWQTRSWLIK